MNKQPKYYLVERNLLPEALQKVVQANTLLQTGEASSTSQAAQMVGLSRSAYYKYRDGIRPFYEAIEGRIITDHFMLHDRAGVLSSILTLFAEQAGNVLTINQSIPMHGQAAVTISARTENMLCTAEELQLLAVALDGVIRAEILASE